MCGTQVHLKTLCWVSCLGTPSDSASFLLGMGELWISPSFSLILLPTEVFASEGLYNGKYKMSVQEQSPDRVYRLFCLFIQMETQLGV